MSITLVFIIATVVISMYGWNNDSFFRAWLHNPFLVQQKQQYYRLLTSGFLHANYMHLGFNMFTLYFIGQYVDFVFTEENGEAGYLLFAALYLGGIVVSDIPTQIKHRNNPEYSSLGASGGVSAIVFCFILFFPTQKLCIFLVLCLPGFLLAILYLIYSWYMAKNQKDNINHDAHFYGALYGAVFAIVYEPEVVLSFVEGIVNFRLF